jgi:hypothetical protein
LAVAKGRLNCYSPPDDCLNISASACRKRLSDLLASLALYAKANTAPIANNARRNCRLSFTNPAKPVGI